MAARHRDQAQVPPAQPHQRERLRYQARLAERQCHPADPDNRLVTAELERRWEAPRRELQEAEERFRQPTHQPSAGEALRPEERDAFLQAGQKIPALWQPDLLSRSQQKAFVRCLRDKGVVHRVAPDTLQVRIVWRGGAPTTAALSVPVGALARLSGGAQMEKQIRELAKTGKTDAASAALLTEAGQRSSKHATVRPSTVRISRLRQRLLRERRQSHPRHMPGFLTVPQVACAIGVTPHWIYERIHNGTMRVTRDRHTHLYLFPDKPKTIALFQQLRAGTLQKLRF